MIKEIGKKKTNNLKDIDCFLFDMDGTIYLGSEIIDGAAELIAEIKAQHKRAVYITNNSARTAIQYVNKLAGMGIHSEEKDFFTSADALVHFLDKMNAGRRPVCTRNSRL